MQQYLRQRQQKLKKSQRRTNNLEKIISEQLNDSKKGMVTKMTILFLYKNFDYPEKPLKYKHIRRISD